MGMNNSASYYTQGQAEDAMSVVAGWIGRNRKVRVIYHNGSAVDADIERGIIRIPRMACASGVTQEALMLLRHNVYHEAGHIDETDVPKPPDELGEVMNALEDRRMETSIGNKHKGCALVFREGNEWYNKDIAKKALANGGLNAPLWEALVAMGFQVDGMNPAWTISKKAQAYIDAAYDEFSKVKLCKDASDCLELAKRILPLLGDANEQYKKENPNPPQQQGNPQPQPGGEQGEEQEPQGGGCGDFADEDDQQDGENNEPDADDKDDAEENSESGKSKKPGDKDEEGDEDDAEGSQKGDSDEDGEGESEEDGDAKGDEDGESENGGKDGEGDDADGNGDGDDEGDEDGQSSGSGEGEEGEDGEGDEDGDAESSGDGDSDSEGQQDGEDSENGKGEKKDGPDGDTPYEPNDERQQGGSDGSDGGEEDEWKYTDLADELDGPSREKAMNDAIEDLLGDLDPSDASYLSRRDLDEHNIPETRDGDKAEFKRQHEEIAVMTASMTRALEQALRSICRSKREGYKRQGRIDRKRLTAIAKGLSREVFYQIRDGQNLECAVEIILDESGSMHNYYQVRLLAIAIGEALNAIGVPFEITGTTTKYGMGAYGIPALDGMSRTNPIRYNHYVMFGESWQSVRHRLIHTNSHMHNIDGEAVEYCAFRLAQRSERRKIIFSLSDGRPCGGQGTDSELGRNLVRVCEKARKNGVEVYGFGVGTDEPERYYGKKYFVYLDDPTTMDQVFIRKFADVVTGGQVRV